MAVSVIVSAQESVGRGRPIADGAEWVGAGVPFYNIGRRDGEERRDT